MNIGLEVFLTILGGVTTAVVVVFGLGVKFNKYDTKITSNEKNTAKLFEKIEVDEKRIDALDIMRGDVKRLADKQSEHERRVDGLARDVMELSTNILSRFSEEIRPIRESIALLTKQSIQSESSIEHFKVSVEDIKETMKEIKRDIRTRPCISHGVHMERDDGK